MLVFLAADVTRLGDLRQAVRSHLAWQSIRDDAESLSLDPPNARQAESKAADADETVASRIPETYIWVLNPSLPPDNPTGEVQWETARVTASGPLAERVSHKLVHDESLIPAYGGTRLRWELDRIPLWRDNQVRPATRKWPYRSTSSGATSPSISTCPVLFDARYWKTPSATGCSPPFGPPMGSPTPKDTMGSAMSASGVVRCWPPSPPAAWWSIPMLLTPRSKRKRPHGREQWRRGLGGSPSRFGTESERTGLGSFRNPRAWLPPALGRVTIAPTLDSNRSRSRLGHC